MGLKTLKPSTSKHLKNINTGDIYEGTIYLGIHDTEQNYIEVSQEEYEKYLEEKNYIEVTQEENNLSLE